MSKEFDTHTFLQPLIEDIRKNTFVAGYHATDAECLGIALARYFQWNGLEVLKTAFSALEDSNYHTENVQVMKLINKLERRNNLPVTK